MGINYLNPYFRVGIEAADEIFVICNPDLGNGPKQANTLRKLLNKETRDGGFSFPQNHSHLILNKATKPKLSFEPSPVTTIPEGFKAWQQFWEQIKLGEFPELLHAGETADNIRELTEQFVPDI